MISLSRRRELRGVRLPRVFGRETERIRSAEDILGKTIRPAPRDGQRSIVTVTGVFDAGDDFSAYDDLRDAELPAEAEAELEESLFRRATAYSFASVCFVSEGFYEYNR